MPAPTTLFTEAEARAFNGGKLADADKYPAADITAVETRIREEFRHLCGVSFIPMSSTVTLDGVCSSSVLLPFHNPLKESPPRPLSVTAATIDGKALTQTELADVYASPAGVVTRKRLGYWLGSAPYLGTVSITVTHGYATVPEAVKRAALIVLCAQLIPTDIAANATSYSDGMMTYQVGYAGDWPHPYGLHEVDAVLLRYRENRVVIA